MSIRPYRDILRRRSRQIHVGNVAVGGDACLTERPEPRVGPIDDLAGGEVSLELRTRPAEHGPSIRVELDASALAGDRLNVGERELGADRDGGPSGHGG